MATPKSRINIGKNPNSVKNRFKIGHKVLKGSEKGWFKKDHKSSHKFPKGNIPWNKGLKRYNAQEKHPQWKGGIAKINNIIRSCFEYRQWRSDIFHKNNFTCQICFVRGGTYLNADHYPKMFSEIIESNEIKSLEDALNCQELWDINNGRTLCKSCHKKFHERLRRTSQRST